MNPKLIVCAAASALLCGCASTPDWNSGPYAEFGFTYDLSISPVAALTTDDAKAVLDLPSTYVPAVFMHRTHDVNFYQPVAPAPMDAPLSPGTIENVPASPTVTPPPPNAPPPAATTPTPPPQ